MKAKKSLGQHWLVDEDSLQAVIAAADLYEDDVVLEAGPGQGALTKYLVEQTKEVWAVELDPDLATSLPKAKNLRVFSQNILDFDLSQLPENYKVVANIPYYLTSNLIRRLLEAENQPSRITLLIQKEVAERIAAGPGQMSILAVSAQFYADVQLHELVPADHFRPVPKVDSQIITLIPLPQQLFAVDSQAFFRVVKAGFGEKRKKLSNSLAGGLDLSKQGVEKNLINLGISPNARPQELSLQQWHDVFRSIQKHRR